MTSVVLSIPGLGAGRTVRLFCPCGRGWGGTWDALGTFTQVPRWGVIRAAVHPETTQPQATEGTEFGPNSKVVRNERFQNVRDLDVGAREPGVHACGISRGGTRKVSVFLPQCTCQAHGRSAAPAFLRKRGCSGPKPSSDREVAQPSRQLTAHGLTSAPRVGGVMGEAGCFLGGCRQVAETSLRVCLEPRRRAGWHSWSWL